MEDEERIGVRRNREKKVMRRDFRYRARRSRNSPQHPDATDRQIEGILRVENGSANLGGGRLTMREGSKGYRLAAMRSS